MPEPLPIAVLISGSGSNLQALIDAQADGALACAIEVVISDRPNVKGLDRAQAAGIPTRVVAWADHTSRNSFTDAVCGTAVEFGAEALVLAGFMRILSPSAVRRYPNAIINVHPALLPAFPGAHAVPEALAHGVTLTGVTVHFVDAEVDHGPIIAQEAVPVLPGDDEGSLHARIQAVEHRLLPQVVDAFCRGLVSVKGRQVSVTQHAMADESEEVA
ncbi:MAG: phosphoribosylglycinamide formyltransferase [Acidimicrobiia bacterium]